MNIDKTKAVCFTGHRPERLYSKEKDVIAWLHKQIDKAVEDGYTTFISGMQRGVDLWAAEYVIELKRTNPDLKLIAANAFRGMADDWSPRWTSRYDWVNKCADEIVFVSSYPGRAAFFQRNEWMVDRSSLVLAVYEGEPGGTKKTIIYAVANNVKVIQMNKDK